MGLGEFKLISLNVRGLSNFKNRKSILSWCRKQKVDIIFLQETHSTVQKEKQWKAEWGGPIELAHGSTNARGVGIFFRNGFDCKISKKIVDPLGRYIALEAIINDESYFLVNIYTPNKDSESAKFYDHLINVFKKDDRTFEDKIIVGDFNCPLNQMDKKGGIMITRQSIVDRIEEIQSVFNLHDIWRVKNPNLKSFTWSQKSPFIFCRLDYWLISDALFDMVKGIDIVPSIKTDHSAISLHFKDLENVSRGPGFWKMNQSLLKDNAFVETMQEKLVTWKEEGNEFSDKRVAWDWVKYNVRLFCIQESKSRAKVRREEENTLQKNLQEAQINFQRHPNDETKKELDFCTTQMETFYDKKMEGTIIRLRGRWHEYGEKSN